MTGSLLDHYANLFIDVYKATSRGTIDWELTSDTLLMAKLGETYFVTLELVEDFEGREEEPDQILRLFRGEKMLIRVDRTSFGPRDLEALYDDTVSGPFPLFKRLWERARMKAMNLDSHLATVSKLLKRGGDGA